MLLRWGFPGSGTILTAPAPLPAMGSATLMKEEAGSQVAGGCRTEVWERIPPPLRVQAAVTCGYLCCD